MYSTFGLVKDMNCMQKQASTDLKTLGVLTSEAEDFFVVSAAHGIFGLPCG